MNFAVKKYRFSNVVKNSYSIEENMIYICSCYLLNLGSLKENCKRSSYIL